MLQRKEKIKFNTKLKHSNSSDVVACYKRAMLASLASLLIGNTKEAVIFLKVGLLNGNINSAVDIKKMQFMAKQ
jgi:hypothetical protein